MAKTATKRLDRQRRHKARRHEAIARRKQRQEDHSREIYAYGYTISQITTNGHVWVLQRGDVLATGRIGDGSEAIKVWHSEGYASLSSRYDHPNHQPYAVPLDEWLTHWTPHLASQGVRVAVNPYPRHPATTSTANSFAADLREGLQRWGPHGRGEPKPTLPGRWVNSQDLLPGDILVNRNGDPQMVTAMRQEYVSALPVFNLTIDKDHTFAVGKTGILVHNTKCKSDFHGDNGTPVEEPEITPQQRGRLKEGEVLDDLGIRKNNGKVSTSEGNSIPDGLTDDLSVEVKDAKNVARTKQIRIQTDAAKEAGRKSVLVTGDKTDVSGPAQAAFDEVRRRPDLGPQ